MNKVASALIAIICTIISVGIMIHNKGNINNDYVEEESPIPYSSTGDKRVVIDITKNEENKKTSVNTNTVLDKEVSNGKSISPEPQTKNENISISEDNKEKILLAAKKLSPIDYEKTLVYLNGENSGNGVIAAIKLLKGRLPDSDYEKIKDVGDIYIR